MKNSGNRQAMSIFFFVILIVNVAVILNFIIIGFCSQRKFKKYQWILKLFFFFKRNLPYHSQVVIITLLFLHSKLLNVLYCNVNLRRTFIIFRLVWITELSIFKWYHSISVELFFRCARYMKGGGYIFLYLLSDILQYIKLWNKMIFAIMMILLECYKHYTTWSLLIFD